MIQQNALLRVSWDCSPGVSWASFSYGSSTGGKYASELIQVVSRIHFLVGLGLKTPVFCQCQLQLFLGPAGYSQFFAMWVSLMCLLLHQVNGKNFWLWRGLNPSLEHFHLIESGSFQITSLFINSKSIYCSGILITIAKFLYLFHIQKSEASLGSTHTQGEGIVQVSRGQESWGPP